MNEDNKDTDFPLNDLEIENVVQENENPDNEMFMDLSAIMRMANDFLQINPDHDTLKGLSQFLNIPFFQLPAQAENQWESPFILISQEDVDKIVNKLEAMQMELTNIKEKNADLYDLIVNLEKRFNEYWDGK